MSEDQLERVSRIARKLDDQAAAQVRPVSNPQKDAEYLRLAMGDLPSSEPAKEGFFARLSARLFPSKRTLLTPWSLAVGLGAALLIGVPASVYLRSVPLPLYDCTVEGDKIVLSGSSPTSKQARARQDSTLKITLQPATRAPAGVQVRAYRLDSGHPEPLLLGNPSPSASGTFRLARTPQELALPLGISEVVFVLATADQQPSPSELEASLAKSDPTSAHGWQVQRITITVLPALK